MRLSCLIHSSPPLGCSSPIPVHFLSSITSKSLTLLDSHQVKYFPLFRFFPSCLTSLPSLVLRAVRFGRPQPGPSTPGIYFIVGRDLPSWANFSSVQDTVCDGWRSPPVHTECLSVHSLLIPHHSIWRNCPWAFCRTACARTAYRHVPTTATWRQVQRSLKAIRLYFKSILSTLF